MREAAERALQLYNEALGLVNSLKQQLLDLIAQMAAAAANGDRALYEKLKAMVEKLKEQLRVAERKLEEARIAYNNAAAQAPGYAPEAAPRRRTTTPSSTRTSTRRRPRWTDSRRRFCASSSS